MPQIFLIQLFAHYLWICEFCSKSR